MQANNSLIFNPCCEIGDIIYHKMDIANEAPLIVCNFTIVYVDKDIREVKVYTIGCITSEGNIRYLYPFELKSVENEGVLDSPSNFARSVTDSFMNPVTVNYESKVRVPAVKKKPRRLEVGGGYVMAADR